MKANVVTKTKVQAAYEKGTQDAYNLLLILAQIALNEHFGFGKKRLELFENEVEKLNAAIHDDGEMLSHDVVVRFRKIRGLDENGKQG